MLSEKVVVSKSKKPAAKTKAAKTIKSSKTTSVKAERNVDKKLKAKVSTKKLVTTAAETAAPKRKRGRPNKLELLRERFRRGRPRKDVAIARALIEEKKSKAIANLTIGAKAKS
jgi:hypothetical protein